MSKTMFSQVIAGLLATALAGCTGTLQREKTAPEQGAATSRHEAQAAARSAPPAIPLTPDIIYAVLVGEIAAQRGQLAMASNHYRLAAKLSHDAATTERAARIAVLLNDEKAARETVAMWVDMDPDNPVAHQVAAALYARERQTAQAVNHLKELVRLAKASNSSGFMQAVAVAGKLKDRGYGLELMRQLVAGYEDDPEALYAYALVAAGAGDYDEAESRVRKALEARPDWPQASVLLSRILVQKGDVTGALAVLEEAVGDKPDSLILRTAYARQLVEAHRLESAYDQFVELLKRRPDNSDVLLSAGIVALELGKYDAARRDFETLLEQGGQKDKAVYYLGQTEEAEGNLETAVKWYGRVSGSYQMDAEVRRARLLAKLGRLDEGRDLIQRLRVQEPQQAVALYLVEAEMLRDAGRTEQVMQLYDRALKSYPDNPDLLYDRALYAAELGRLDILERDLTRVIQEDPDNADALNALGYTLADQTSRYAEALGYIRRALALKPDNAAVLDSMGWVQYRLGNTGEALAYLRRAFELDADAEIAAHLGEVLWVSGERDEARRVWKDSLVRNPDDKLLKRLMKYGPAHK